MAFGRQRLGHHRPGPVLLADPVRDRHPTSSKRTSLNRSPSSDGIGAIEMPGDVPIDDEQGEPARVALDACRCGTAPRGSRRDGRTGRPALLARHTYSSPSRTARVRSPGEVGPGLGLGVAEREEGVCRRAVRAGSARAARPCRSAMIVFATMPDPSGGRAARGVCHLVPQDELVDRWQSLAAAPRRPGQRQPAALAERASTSPHARRVVLALVEEERRRCRPSPRGSSTTSAAERLLLGSEHRGSCAVHGRGLLARSSTPASRFSANALGPSLKSGWSQCIRSSAQPYSRPA